MRAQRLLALVALAAFAAAPAHADFKRSYSKGMDAASAGKWDEVEARMREALAENPTPQSSVRLYGMLSVPYVPQYYLGMAAYKRGDCSGAMRYWDKPDVVAVVNADTAMSGQAQSGMRDCKVKLAQTGTTTTPTVVANNPPTTTDNPVKPPPPPVKDNPPATVDPTTVAVNKPPPPIVTPPPPPPTKPPPTTTPTAAVEAPAELVSALDNFLMGRYAQAAALDPNRLADNRAKFHALLVRAASRHVLGQLQGEAGANLINLAQADVRAAKALQPAAQPDATVFSPRFRQFYSVTR